MARFLLGDEWFDQLSSTALYESGIRASAIVQRAGIVS